MNRRCSPPANKTRPNLGKRTGGGVSLKVLFAFALLLVIPSFALGRCSGWLDRRILAGAEVAISLLTFLAYRIDKRRAEGGRWRIPESVLHLAEFLGGWPGAFLAQRLFRHKTAKLSYQVSFWSIVLIHQLIAADFLSGWKFTGAVLHAFKSHHVHTSRLDLSERRKYNERE